MYSANVVDPDFGVLKRGKFFSEQEIDLLLEFYGDVELQTWMKRNPRKHTIVWKDLADKLTMAGFPRTSAQVKDKILNLRRRYLAYMRCLQVGDNPPEWKHLEKLHQLYQDHELFSPISFSDVQLPYHPIAKSCPDKSAMEAVTLRIQDIRSLERSPPEGVACGSFDEKPPRCIEDTLFTDLFPISFSESESDKLGKDPRWGVEKLSVAKTSSPSASSPNPNSEPTSPGSRPGLLSGETSSPVLHKLDEEVKQEAIGPLDSYYRHSLCRLCFRTNKKLVNIFDEHIVEGYKIKDAIVEFLHIQVSKTDDFPHNACNFCIRKLSDFKKFKDQYLKYKEMFVEELEIFRQSKAGNAEISTPGLPSKSHDDHPIQAVFLDCKKELDDTPSDFEGVPGCEKDPLEISCEGESDDDTFSGAHEMSEDWDAEDEGGLPTDYVEVRLLDVDGEIKCKDCGQVFQYRNQLMEHSKEHEKLKPLPCSYCDRRFKTLIELNNHIITHSDYRPFECEHCGLRFRFKVMLARHKLLHTSLKPYKCSECGKTFPSKLSLKQHLVRTHLIQGKKLFGCDNCGKEFGTNPALQTHILRMHSNERPFACQYCSKAYVTSMELKRHLNSVHPSTPKEVYKCWICDRCYPNEKGVLRHMKSHQVPEKPSD